MSSAINHKKRSRRGYRRMRSVANGATRYSLSQQIARSSAIYGSAGLFASLFRRRASEKPRKAEPEA